MVHKKIRRIIDCEKQCKWPHLIASDAACIQPPPPVIVPEGSIIPTVYRYFYIAATDISLVGGATLSASLFSDDFGQGVTTMTLFQPNGYVNLYINAVMQEAGIYTITSEALSFAPYPATIYRGTPIIIESLGFHQA
ncbi:DUF4183 domain-containing protein [Lysinibacillus piscis]|uniref:DUF4183 domain-containing protein n=1 Tax=Lysinibacillus piscis TaxID=2518931 RepID=A0ABQ5NF96_9BACI|nr:DUF4183 domain-containing protein [Lysinibacillus sp. KH24]GLC86945.1 hypothetical protein LYSBPC_00720 [Lysinibacillus sp. KH24]